jgi:hypothetical protein
MRRYRRDADRVGEPLPMWQVRRDGVPQLPSSPPTLRIAPSYMYI